MKLPIAAVLATMSLSSCSHAQANLLKRAAFDLDCPEAQLRTQKIGGAWGVAGCGRSASYVIVGQPPYRQWVMNSVQDNRDEAHGTAAAPTPSRGRSQLSSVKHADGYTLLTGQVSRPMGQLGLRVVGAPTRDADHVLLALAQASMAPKLKDCPLRMVVNGGALPLPEFTYHPEARKEELRIKLPLSMLAEIARAERVVAQVCEQRIELSDEESAMLREFMMRFQEELVLSGSAPTTPVGDPSGASTL